MFHFTTRDVFWLTTLSAVLVGWGMDHVKSAIDWSSVKATELQLRAAKAELLLAQAQTERTRQEHAALVRVANQLGLSVLDVEPETKLNANLVSVE
jgi:hypothetical protein